MAQVYFEDVSEGQEIPKLVQNCDSQRLVLWAAGSGDYYQIHYDKDFAAGNELDGVILHGALKNAFLGQLMTQWMGPEGVLKKLSCQYRGMDVPGQTITGKGTVIRKYQEQGQNLVDCQIWLENPKGEKTTPGAATVTLPSR
ncbi:MAG: dehydratase [Chloroflexi bacterium]|nr:dehydratase [Chloroflexota bacterium]